MTLSVFLFHTHTLFRRITSQLRNRLETFCRKLERKATGDLNYKWHISNGTKSCFFANSFGRGGLRNHITAAGLQLKIELGVLQVSRVFFGLEIQFVCGYNA